MKAQRALAIFLLALGCGQDAPVIDAPPPPPASIGCTAHGQCASLVCLRPASICADPADVAYARTRQPASITCTLAAPCSDVEGALATGRDIVRVIDHAFAGFGGPVRVARPISIYGDGPGTVLLGYNTANETTILFVLAGLDLIDLDIACDDRWRLTGIEVRAGGRLSLDRVAFRGCVTNIVVPLAEVP